ncbi:MAG: dethiobiotin synthase [Opitutales bacterium]
MTLLVSGSGTGVGKTRVVGALARVAARNGRSVQIIKPVQTGLAPGEPSDADLAAQFADLPPNWAHTLRRYPAALAPLDAACAASEPLDIKSVIQEILSLPPPTIRLIEGAGGVAVPLAANGWDWVEFAEAVHADAVILVVPDELGAINQSRLVCDYFWSKYRERPPGSVFLNALRPPPPEVAASTRAALEACGIPLWGELAADAGEPVLRRLLTKLLVA